MVFMGFAEINGSVYFNKTGFNRRISILLLFTYFSDLFILFLPFLGENP